MPEVNLMVGAQRAERCVSLHTKAEIECSTAVVHSSGKKVEKSFGTYNLQSTQHMYDDL